MTRERTGARARSEQPQPQPAPSAGALTVIDFAADAGAGIEGADRDSYAIPFLAVLQPMSPQIETVKGAKAGMLINTVTNEIYESAKIIPCAFQRRWVRWGAREAGGGFKGEFTTAEVNAIRERGEVKDLEGRLYYPLQDGSVNPKRCDRLADTRSHYSLLVTGADLGIPIVLALTSTGIRVSKNLMSRIEGKKIRNSAGALVTAPSFSTIYNVRTEQKANESGKWWLPVIEPVGEVTNPSLYAMAKAFHAQVMAGRVRAAHETRQDGAEPGEGSGGSGEPF